MKVLHIGTEMQWRGGENQIFLLSKFLKNSGVQSVGAFPQGAMALEKFAAQDFDTFELASKGGYSIKDALRILKYCRENNVDIIHAHSGRAHSLAYLAKVFGTKVKLVVHRRVAFSINNSFLTNKKYLSKRVDQFISISDAIKKILLDYGVKESKISVARSSVDSKKFDKLEKQKCLESFNLSPNGPLIGVIAAFTEEKGHEILIESLSQINNDFTCVFAGSGKEEEKIKKLCKEKGLEKKVRFLGFIDNPEVLLKALDILVIPSRSEGLGSIALDGMLAGCLVIASNTGGLPEIVQDKKTGFLFEVGDWGKLKEILEKQMNGIDPSILEQAKKHVEENFSLPVMAEKTLEVYKKITQ